MKKLSALLAITDNLASSFKAVIKDTAKFFSTKQDQFRGIKRVYTPTSESVDDPTKRGVTNVVTTVGEQLQWIESQAVEYIDSLFSQEATNAAGVAKARLVVDGVDFGELSSLELLRLKSILEMEDISKLYSSIPVRVETKDWKKTIAENYQGRNIFEDELARGENKTTEKEEYVLTDPNIAAAIAAGKDINYTPSRAVKTIPVKLGDMTVQNFSGEASHRERANVLTRLTKLKTAVLAALKEANDVESVPSEMTSSKLFSYLHGELTNDKTVN